MGFISRERAIYNGLLYQRICTNSYRYESHAIFEKCYLGYLNFGKITCLFINFHFDQNSIVDGCCKLGEHGIRKGLDVNFFLINQSNGSYLYYSKIDYIKFYSAQLNSQFQYNSKSARVCNACMLNSRR